MKKLSSIFYMWMGFAFAIIAVLCMFLPCLWFEGGTKMAASLFWPTATHIHAWPSFIGYMLILLGAIGMGVMALPMVQPSAKTEKIVLISAAFAILVGVILAFLIKPFLACLGGYDINSGYFGDPGTSYRTGMYLTLFFGVASIVMDGIALALDW